MSDTLASLRHKISGAGDLKSVVRSMKALAASSIGQYENSVRALADYDRTIELGLAVCLRNRRRAVALEDGETHAASKGVTAIVFGSDQGLVGQFNDVLADFVASGARASPRRKESLGRRRAHSIAAGGCRPRAGGALYSADVRERHHAPRRSDPRGERSPSRRARGGSTLPLPQSPQAWCGLRSRQSAPAAA